MNNNHGVKHPSKAEQALNSVEAAHRSVSQAVEHPTSQMIDQADRSLRHAEAAVDQADMSGSEEAANLAKEQLRKEQRTLGGN